MRLVYLFFMSCVTFMIATSCSSSSSSHNPESSKSITAFTFASPPAVGAISETTHTIKITVPYGTDLTTITPQIDYTGASVSPATNTVQDFTSPVTYTVTAEDSSSQDYIVTVLVAPIDAKEITSFIIDSPYSIGSIVEDIHSIFVTVPFGTDPTTLIPTIIHTGASISPLSGESQDFSSPLIYTVTAADSSTQDYTVSVTVAASDAKAITSFKFENIPAEGIITEATHTIEVTVPYGTDLSELIPTIQHTGASVYPGTGTMQDFSAPPFVYAVTAGDSSTQDYTVTVTEAPADSKSILLFNTVSPNVEGVITEGTLSITLMMPNGTDIHSLTPQIIHTGTSISPELETAQDFTNPVVYTVTAADASTQDYTVSVDMTPWATCGDSIYYGRQNYSTVQIGSQCWFAENLSIGTSILGGDDQGTSCVDINKYCYGDDENNCLDYGGLYTWTQAMCGADYSRPLEELEEWQGICPDGWHIPSNPEFVTITQYLGSGVIPTYWLGSAVYFGAPAGDRMKLDGLCQGRTPCGDSGFEGYLHGEFYQPNTFAGVGTYSVYWTSSKSIGGAGNEAYRAGLSLDSGGVISTYWWSDYSHGFAIRCLKD